MGVGTIFPAVSMTHILRTSANSVPAGRGILRSMVNTHRNLLENGFDHVPLRGGHRRLRTELRLHAAEVVSDLVRDETRNLKMKAP